MYKWNYTVCFSGELFTVPTSSNSGAKLAGNLTRASVFGKKNLNTSDSVLIENSVEIPDDPASVRGP